jgi:tryptophan synthase beta chain
MTAYESYTAGTMQDFVPTDEDLAVSMNKLPKIPGIQE